MSPGGSPLFADRALVARIEAAECDLVRSCTLTAFEHDPTLRERGLCRDIAGGVATFSRDDSPLNKVAGLGLHGPVDPSALEGLERAYAERGATTVVELASLADPSLPRLLSARGYVVVGFENVLGRTLVERGDAAAPPSITVRESAAEEYERWLDILVSGFVEPSADDPETHTPMSRESLLPVLRGMAQADSFRRYLAEVDGAAAGGASIRLDQARRLAQLCGAATLPAYRRRGVQGALLRARLADARDRGCELVVVTTQPGSTSQHNVQRQGFQLLYTRAIFAKEAPGPAEVAAR